MEQYDLALHKTLNLGFKKPDICPETLGIRAQKEGRDTKVSLVSTRAQPLFLLYNNPIREVCKKRFSDAFAQLLAYDYHEQLVKPELTSLDKWIDLSPELQLLIYHSANGGFNEKTISLEIYFDKTLFLGVKGANFSQAHDNLVSRVSLKELEEKVLEIEREKRTNYQVLRYRF